MECRENTVFHSVFSFSVAVGTFEQTALLAFCIVQNSFYLQNK